MRISEGRAVEIIATFVVPFSLLAIVVGLLINRRDWMLSIRYRRSLGMRTNMFAMFRILVTRSHSKWLGASLLTLPLVGATAFVVLSFRNAVGARAPFLLAHAGVCLLLWILFALWLLVPPSILLLSSSTRRANILQGQIGDASQPLKIVSYVRPSEDFFEIPEELLRGIQLLRSPGHAEWPQDVSYAAQNIPTIVIDHRDATDNLLKELDLLANLGSRREVLVLVDDVSNLGVRIADSHSVLIFHSETELVSYLWRVTAARMND